MLRTSDRKCAIVSSLASTVRTSWSAFSFSVRIRESRLITSCRCFSSWVRATPSSPRSDKISLRRSRTSMFCVLAVPGRERVGAAAAGPAEAPGSLRLLLRPSLSRAFSSFSALNSCCSAVILATSASCFATASLLSDPSLCFFKTSTSFSSFSFARSASSSFCFKPLTSPFSTSLPDVRSPSTWLRAMTSISQLPLTPSNNSFKAFAISSPTSSCSSPAAFSIPASSDGRSRPSSSPPSPSLAASARTLFAISRATAA
mmetsp:Transcript_17602/g.42710  ORF Transcript_17602/g.42710 Transcript_17602/m.42710 type:complete len:259 (+) Transcript_17602:410-1186(+)